MLTRPWYAPYIIGDNDLVSQNVGFGTSSLLAKVELVGCNQQWISEHTVSLNLPVDAYGSSSRVSGLFLLNREIFNYNILYKFLMSRRRIVGIFVMDSVHYLCITRLFGERRDERQLT